MPLEWHNKICTAQFTLCVGNKKGKTELKAFFLVSRYLGHDTIHVSPAQVSRCIDASMHRYDPSINSRFERQHSHAKTSDLHFPEVCVSATTKGQVVCRLGSNGRVSPSTLPAILRYCRSTTRQTGHASQSAVSTRSL